VKSLVRHRPSPALIIALIALFVSLSGVSYGVATGFIDSREIKNNEVRSLDIRNNEIRTRDLRNNEVRGLDIRNSTVQSRDIALNAVTGDDVKEDTLQKVPSALLADSATTADSANSVSTLKIVPPTTVPQGGAPVALASHGALTVFGECVPGPIARISVSTTENDSAAAANAADGGPTNATTTVQQEDVDTSDGRFPIANLTGSPGARAYNVATVSALALSGTGLTGELGLHRDPANNTCRFHGSLSLQG
jgi:hypothetical protein